MSKNGNDENRKNKPKKGTSTIIPLVPAGKIRCFVTGKLRKDTPEEHVRQRWARSLVDEYGYDVSDLHVEFPIKMGVERKAADIVVFKPSAPHRQDSVVIIVEAKREGVSPKHRSEGVEQLKSYMGPCSSCRFGLWVGSEKQAYERLDTGEIEDTMDIPRVGDTQPQPPKFLQLKPATDLKAAFQELLSNLVYGGLVMRRPCCPR